MWLIMQQRIRTKEQLRKIGVIDENHCLLCEDDVENINHLFFECRYSETCLKMIKQWKLKE